MVPARHISLNAILVLSHLRTGATPRFVGSTNGRARRRSDSGGGRGEEWRAMRQRYDLRTNYWTITNYSWRLFLLVHAKREAIIN